MPIPAQIIRVLIASPGDTSSARGVLRQVTDEWNGMHAESAGLILLPSMWERDATPEMGDRAQGVINRQLVDKADLLLGTFWTRLGTPTSEAESGTAEEIGRLTTANKPVLLFFSDEPVVLTSVDQDEYARLLEFRASMKAKGFVDSYGSLEDLRWKALRALTRTIRERFEVPPEALPDLAGGDTPPAAPHARLGARIDRQREVSGFGSSGQPRYSTRERLQVENVGSASAENVVFGVELPADADGSKPFIGLPDGPIGTLPVGAMVDFPMARAFGTASRWDLVMRWNEDDAEYEARQTIV